jgi:hypothetical protein
MNPKRFLARCHNKKGRGENMENFVCSLIIYICHFEACNMEYVQIAKLNSKSRKEFRHLSEAN